MIIFRSIVSHSPLLLPCIQGKNKEEYLSLTRKAYQELVGRLYQKKPDTIIFISPHPMKEVANFLINFQSTYKISFPYFGDFDTYGDFQGEPLIFSQMTTFFRTTSFPISSFSSHVLDYGSGIPLSFFLPQLKETHILPLYTSETLSDKLHVSFGEELSSLLEESPRRIALMVSLDLPRNDQGFNKLILDALQNNQLHELYSGDQNVIQMETCSKKPLHLLSGFLKESRYQSEVLSHEIHEGSGLLMALLQL